MAELARIARSRRDAAACGAFMILMLAQQAGAACNVKAVAPGGSHALAISGDGRLFTWGDNSFGQAAAGAQSELATPTEIPSLAGCKAIAAGEFHSLAVASDGSVWA